MLARSSPMPAQSRQGAPHAAGALQPKISVAIPPQLGMQSDPGCWEHHTWPGSLRRLCQPPLPALQLSGSRAFAPAAAPCQGKAAGQYRPSMGLGSSMAQPLRTATQRLWASWSVRQHGAMGDRCPGLQSVRLYTRTKWWEATPLLMTPPPKAERRHGSSFARP